jgi:hypothetical protein
MYNVGRGAERSRRQFGAVSRAGRRAECRAKFNHWFTGNSARHRDSAGRSPEQSGIHLTERISEHHYAGFDSAGIAAINYQPKRSEQPQQLAQRCAVRDDAEHGQRSSWIGAEWRFVEFQPAIHFRESDQQRSEQQ